DHKCNYCPNNPDNVTNCKVSSDIWLWRLDYWMKDRKYFFDENNTYPSKRSKNEKERKLANWMNTQRQQYKKISFAKSHPTRCSIWGDFILQNSNYFDTSYIEKYTEIE